MADDVATGRQAAEVAAAKADETVRLIDELMAAPSKGLPSIMVFGDDAVFGITPAKTSARGR